jgi:hypothetical protein
MNLGPDHLGNEIWNKVLGSLAIYMVINSLNHMLSVTFVERLKKPLID